MNRRVLPLIIGLLLPLGCGGTSSSPSPPGPNGDDDRTSPTDVDPLPEWLVTLTEQLESEPVANPPAYIARWEYAAGVYYYLPPRCCDIPSTLFDSEGAVVCAPDGGITGGGDGRCPPLGETLSEEIVWRDARGVT